MDHNSINGQGQIDTYYQIFLKKAPSQITTCNLQFSEMPKIFFHFFSFIGQSQISAVRSFKLTPTSYLFDRLVSHRCQFGLTFWEPFKKVWRQYQLKLLTRKKLALQISQIDQKCFSSKFLSSTKTWVVKLKRFNVF